jgi:hypothetical protein
MSLGEREIHTEHNLWRAIPSRSDIYQVRGVNEKLTSDGGSRAGSKETVRVKRTFRHEPSPSIRSSIWWWKSGRPGETKVADLEVAVGVEEEVRRFEISVKDIGGVESFQTSKSLLPDTGD